MTLQMNSVQVGIAAEAYVAGALAQCGCDVTVQYGANQPEYDLIATKGNVFRKISVKGSNDGGWALLASLEEGRSCHEAIEAWRDARSDAGVIFAFVQFKGVAIGEMPRIYLSRIDEVVEYLKSSRGGHGYTSLREHYVWASGIAKGVEDQIPSSWKLTYERVGEIMSTQ